MAVLNEDIARMFDEIADLLEIEEASPYRVLAYRNGARTLASLGDEVAGMLAAGEDLTELPGIGKDLAGKIREAVDSGHIAALDQLRREVPPSLETLLHIPGLGPKRVRALYHGLGIENLEQLQQAAVAGRLSTLPGFGEKTQRHILDQLGARQARERRFLRTDAERASEPLLAHLRAIDGVARVEVAGSYRRGKETVGDLDILVTSTRLSPVMEQFVTYPRVTKVISKGSTRATVLLEGGLQVDLRMVAEQSFGAALHYFTGSKAHNIQIRRLGQQRDLKINEYGVFRGIERVAGETEASVFAAVGLPFIPPELREAQGEVEAAAQGTLPDLVDLDDLRGDLHVHTSASNGHAPLRAMVLAAQAQGFEYLAITDHSPHPPFMEGLDANRLAAQIDAIDQLNEELRGIRILKGMEVDILEDGRLDTPDALLARLDVVVCALHGGYRLSRPRQTERVLRALDNPHVSILAHPTARLLGEREPVELDLVRVMRHARQQGCILEVNSQPKRLDLADNFCRLARDEGVLLSINSGGHREQDFGNLRLGVAQARRGWVEKSDVLNTRSLQEVLRLLAGATGRG